MEHAVKQIANEHTEGLGQQTANALATVSSMFQNHGKKMTPEQVQKEEALMAELGKPYSEEAQMIEDEMMRDVDAKIEAEAEDTAQAGNGKEKKKKRKARKKSRKNEDAEEEDVTLIIQPEADATTRCAHDLRTKPLPAAVAYACTLDVAVIQAEFMKFRRTTERVLEPHLLYLVQVGIVQIWNGLVRELSRGEPEIFDVTSTDLIADGGQDVYEWLEIVDARHPTEEYDSKALCFMETTEATMLEMFPLGTRRAAWDVYVDYATLWAFGGTYPDLGRLSIPGMARVLSEARARDQILCTVRQRILLLRYQHPAKYPESMHDDILALTMWSIREGGKRAKDEDEDGESMKRPFREKSPSFSLGGDVIVASSIGLAHKVTVRSHLTRICFSLPSLPCFFSSRPPPCTLFLFLQTISLETVSSSFICIISISVRSDRLESSSPIPIHHPPTCTSSGRGLTFFITSSHHTIFFWTRFLGAVFMIDSVS